MVAEIQPLRPPFDAALKAWQELLGRRGFPTRCLWLFDENLCLEPDPACPGSVRLGFQTQFSPPPPDAEQIAYYYFSDFPVPLVFYRIGSCRDQSVCLLLCDAWFATKTTAEGFVWNEDWLVAFRPGPGVEIEEITSEPRWRQRIVHGQPIGDLDFCMTLQAIHEILAHDRLLVPYERYAMKFLGPRRRGEAEPKA